MSANVDSNLLHRIDRIKQIIIDLDENIEDKYVGYYPSSNPAAISLQNLDEDGFSNVDGEMNRITRLKYEDTFLKDVHNLLDVYNLCGSSVSAQIEKIGLKQVSQFIKQFILSQRKSMILAMRIICSYNKVPQVIDERRFKVSTYDIEKEVVKEHNAKKYNQKKVKIQKGTVDKDLVYLIKNDLFDKPDLVPENIKVKLGQIYDPLLKEYREAQVMMDETLSNKNKFLNMQPSRAEDYMSKTIKEIQGTTNLFYEFEQNTKRSNQTRDEINQLANKFCSDMIMDELSLEIKGNFEDSARKRMQNVILQVIQFLKNRNEDFTPSVECQVIIF